MLNASLNKRILPYSNRNIDVVVGVVDERTDDNCGRLQRYRSAPSDHPPRRHHSGVSTQAQTERSKVSSRTMY